MVASLLRIDMAPLTFFLLLLASGLCNPNTWSIRRANRKLQQIAGTEMKKYNIVARPGSSVLLPGPGVLIDNEMNVELKKLNGNPDWLASYHGGPLLNGHYINRGHYFQENGSFLLHNVTQIDSGVYEQEVNNNKLVEILLTVIDPVMKPVLSRQDLPGKDCPVVLKCVGSGGRPYNVSFLKNDKDIKENVTWGYNLTELPLYSRDPQSWGKYKCALMNSVNTEVSDWVVVQDPVPTMPFIGFHIAIAALCITLQMWTFSWSVQCQNRNLKQALSYTLIVVRVSSELVASLSPLYFYDNTSVPLFVGLIIFVLLFGVRIYLIRTSKDDETQTSINAKGSDLGNQPANHNKTDPQSQETQTFIDEKDTNLANPPANENQTVPCYKGALRNVADWILNITDFIIVLAISIVMLVLFIKEYGTSPCGREIILDWSLLLPIISPLGATGVLFLAIFLCIKLTQKYNHIWDTVHYLQVRPRDGPEHGTQCSVVVEPNIAPTPSSEKTEDTRLSSNDPIVCRPGDDVATGSSSINNKDPEQVDNDFGKTGELFTMDPVTTG